MLCFVTDCHQTRNTYECSRYQAELDNHRVLYNIGPESGRMRVRIYNWYMHFCSDYVQC
jgi:hypothetical protein